MFKGEAYRPYQLRYNRSISARKIARSFSSVSRSLASFSRSILPSIIPSFF
ncbi:MAG: hypothetical protein LBH59_02440 [Planctomycetaceae bacterium]|nr:hypothetical protein [Planctomycetaceae bacterium]